MLDFLFIQQAERAASNDQACMVTMIIVSFAFVDVTKATNYEPIIFHPSEYVWSAGLSIFGGQQVGCVGNISFVGSPD